MSPREMLMCSGFALALPIGQTMFKWAALHHERTSGPVLIRLMVNVPLLVALAWYAVTALAWFYVLTRVPLSRAYPFALAGTGLVPLIGWLVFHEPVSWRLGAGYVLMLAGLALMQSQSA